MNAGHQSTCRAHCEKCHTQPHGSNPKQTPNSCQKYRTIVGPLECGKRPVLLRSQLNDSYRRTHTGLPSLVSPFRFVSLNRTHVLIRGYYQQHTAEGRGTHHRRTPCLGGLQSRQKLSEYAAQGPHVHSQGVSLQTYRRAGDLRSRQPNSSTPHTPGALLSDDTPLHIVTRRMTGGTHASHTWVRMTSGGRYHLVTTCSVSWRFTI